MDQCIFKIPFENVCIKEQDGEITHISFTKDKLIKTTGEIIKNANILFMSESLINVIK